MSRPVTITDAVLAKLVAFLAPLFVDAAGGDTAAARQTAASVLASYGARTDTELRFVALIVAFSFAALDALSRSADPTLTTNQVLRLRSNANALNRAAHGRINPAGGFPPSCRPGNARTPGGTPRGTATGISADLPASTEPSDMLAFARFQPPAESPPAASRRRTPGRKTAPPPAGRSAPRPPRRRT